MATVHFSEDTLLQTMRSDQTRAALAARADKIAGNARGRVSAHGMRAEVVREDGTRPKGRPYSRVSLIATGNAQDAVPPVVRRVVLEHSL